MGKRTRCSECGHLLIKAVYIGVYRIICTNPECRLFKKKLGTEPLPLDNIPDKQQDRW